MSLEIILQLITSALTIVSVWYNGDKNLWGPRIGVIANSFWWVMVIYCEMWGMLPLQVMMCILAWRMLIKWEKDARAKETR